MNLGGVAVLLGVVLAPAVVLARPLKSEPAGFGKARFGMSPAEVQKLYPEAHTLGNENLGAISPLGPAVVRHLLVDQKVEGLEKPVQVELRYWKERLWVVVVYYGKNPTERVHAMLRKRLGRAPGAEPVWNGEKATVMTDNRGRWYAISDKALSHEVYASLRGSGKSTRVQRPPARRLPVGPAAGSATPPGP